MLTGANNFTKNCQRSNEIGSSMHDISAASVFDVMPDTQCAGVKRGICAAPPNQFHRPMDTKTLRNKSNTFSGKILTVWLMILQFSERPDLVNQENWNT